MNHTTLIISVSLLPSTSPQRPDACGSGTELPGERQEAVSVRRGAALRTRLRRGRHTARGVRARGRRLPGPVS